MAKIRVLLADDHAAILAQVRLELADDFDIVGMVANGRDAIDAVLRLNPDVLVTDISMPILERLGGPQPGGTANPPPMFLTVHFFYLILWQLLFAPALSATSRSVISQPISSRPFAECWPVTFLSPVP